MQCQSVQREIQYQCFAFKHVDIVEFAANFKFGIRVRLKKLAGYPAVTFTFYFFVIQHFSNIALGSLCLFLLKSLEIFLFDLLFLYPQIQLSITGQVAEQ